MVNTLLLNSERRKWSRGFGGRLGAQALGGTALRTACKFKFTDATLLHQDAPLQASTGGRQVHHP